jgi:hypothetical protein
LQQACPAAAEVRRVLAPARFAGSTKFRSERDRMVTVLRVESAIGSGGSAART